MATIANATIIIERVLSAIAVVIIKERVLKTIAVTMTLLVVGIALPSVY